MRFISLGAAMSGRTLRSLLNHGRGVARRVLAAGLPPLLLSLLLAWPVSAADTAPDLVVLSTPFTVPVKYQHLQTYADEAGLKMRHHVTGKHDEQAVSADLAQAGLVVLDAAREVDLLALRKLSGKPRRLLAVQGGKVSGDGLDSAELQALGAYYSNGGAHNGRQFMRAVARMLGRPGPAPEAAQILPSLGIYHPSHPQRVLTSLAEYRRWHKLGQAPAAAVAVLRSYLVGDATGHIDALISELEARGVLPVVFYSPAGPVDLLPLLKPADVPGVGVFINTQVQYDTSRQALYHQLGVPVIQAMTRWGDGGAAAWMDDREGIAAASIPFYIALPEITGASDPLVFATMEQGVPTVIPEQLAMVAGKAARWLKLRETANADKRVGLMFYNYPAGEKNLSAASLNVPRSLDALLKSLARQGYAVEPRDEKALIQSLQRLLAPFYRDGELDALLRDNLAAKLPLADYQRWFATLPDSVRKAVNERWGAPEKSPMFSAKDGEPGFVVPRLQIGKLSVLPQPPRGERLDDQEKALYHDTKSPPNHFYMAAYLWLREHARADALIHFGTHGTQEWMPGKERGLWAYDAPMLVLGDLPVLYPYIVDDVGEALQAKRRGRAVTISYQTPPFAPAGLHERLGKLNDLILEYQIRDDGAVRDRVQQKILSEAAKQNVIADMEWTPEHARTDFPAFLDALHDHIESLVNMNQPRGLHSFGLTESEGERISTLMQMLRQPLATALALKPEQSRLDYKDLPKHPAYQWLRRHVADAAPLPADASPAQQTLLAQARQHWQNLDASPETDALLAGLAGHFIQPGTGGDVIRNPDGIPTGRNLYGFDPSRVPSEAAWQTGEQALNALLADYKKENGRDARKLTFALWAVETMRHGGVLEAQVLAALGVKPTWDDSGRISGVTLIPRAQLGRPRVDVVLSATGLYRDQLPGLMQLINEAVTLAAKAEEQDNPVYSHTTALEARLRAAGIAAEDASRHARTRVFASRSGDYGTGLNDAVAASDTWDKDAKLAALYLRRMSYAFGPDDKHWNEATDALPGGINLYAEHLKGTDVALLSRSSNLYGMLTTDDPFQYLGGLSLAIHNLTGQDPKLMISNLRDAQAVRHESAARFLAQELATRQFHPGWISALQKEGYAGTLEIVDSLNNFWGWQVVAPSTTRADQWQSFHEVYVKDRYQLGVQKWFEQHNPTAQAQLIERMLEAVRKDYWNASRQTRKELLQRWQALAAQGQASTRNQKLAAFIEAQIAGFGLNAPAAVTPAAPAPAAEHPPATPAPANPATKTAPDTPADTVRGQKLTAVATPDSPQAPLWPRIWIAAALLLITATGAVHARRQLAPTR